MTLSRSALAAQVAELESDELVRRVQAGRLTDVALDIVRAELERRGIDAAPAPHGEDVEEALLDSGGDLVALASLDKPTEAHILVARLQTEGIHAIAADAHLGQTHPFLRFAGGGVRVLVAQKQIERARALLAALDRGELALDDGERSAAPEPPACPVCGGARVRTRLAGMFRSLVLWNDSPRWQCADCGKTWASST